MDIHKINALSYEEFVDILGNVVEKCPIITAAVWSRVPFANLADLETAVSEFIDSLPESGKEGILRCHPDLAGKDLQSGTLTQASREEQAHAGLDTLDAADISRMTLLNTRYKERFGFPFVICARLNNKATIIRQLTDRLQNGRSEERAHAIEEVKKICRLRLQAAVLTESPNKL